MPLATTTFTKHDHQALTRTRRVIDRETGLPLIIREQNTAPVLEDNKRWQTRRDRHELRQQNLNGGVMVANIPNHIYWDLRRKGIAQDPQLMRAWLNQPFARFFRTDDGRQI